MKRVAGILSVCLLLAACECLPIPTSDSSPPTAGIVVDFQDTSGNLQSVTLSAQDADVTYTVDRHHPIGVIYTGQDDQGLREIHLVYDMVLNSSSGGVGTSTQPTLVPISQEADADCPLKTMTGAHTFDPGGEDWDYEISCRAVNWMGTSTTSAKLTLHAR